MGSDYQEQRILNQLDPNLRFVFINTGDLAILFSAENGQIDSMNNAAQKALLEDKNQYSNKSITSVTPVLSPDRIKDKTEKEEITGLDVTFQKFDGDTLPVTCSLSKVIVEDSTYYLVIGQRKNTATQPQEPPRIPDIEVIQELKHREATIRSIFQAAPIGMGTLIDRKFTNVNDRFCEITEFTREDLLGKKSEVVYVSREEYERVGKILYEDRNIVGTIESKFKTKSGRIIDVLITTSVYATADDKYLVVFTVTDITEFNKTQCNLLQSKQRMTTLLSNLQGTVYRCKLDEDWTMVFLSDAVTNLTGYEKKDILGNKTISYNDIIHPDDRDYVSELIKKAVEQKEQFTLEYRIIDNKGNVKWVLEQGKAVLDENGTMVLEGYINDVTKRKLAEEKIKAHLDELSFLSQAATLMLGISSFNEIFKFISIKLNEIVKKSIVLVFAHEQSTGLMELMHYSGIHKNIEKIIQLLGRNPIGMKFPVSEAGLEILRKQKLIEGPDNIYEISEQRIPKPITKAIEALIQLKKIYLMGILHDGVFLGEIIIFEQKGGEIGDVNLIETFVNQAAIGLLKIQTEQSLRTSEERLRLATKAAQQGLWDLDLKTGITKTNETYFTMLGYEPKSMYTFEDWKSKIHPDDKDHAVKIFNRYVNGEIDEYKIEIRLRKYNGDWAWIITTGEIISSDAQGKPLRMAGTHTDITYLKNIERELIDKNQKIERQNEEYLTINEELQESMERVQLINDELQKAKEKAEESDKLKSAFLANMSHEIRTPMNGIIGFSNMLVDESISEDKRISYAKIIIESSHQLLTIVNDILDISKIETGQISMQNEDFNVNDVVIDLFSFYKPKATEKGILLLPHKDLNDRESIIVTDKSKLKQVLNNLLSNALKFTHEGHIQFGYNYTDNGYLEFFVEDSGIGIPAEYHDKIFERFRQVESTLNRQYGGTGLGLAISKNLVELMGGNIWFESIEGKGSTFYFTVPYQNDPPEEMPEKQIIQPEKQNGFGTILIAEDEEINFLFLEEILSDLHVQILHAQNGLEAVNICKANPDIVLVLMDIKMPVMNGFDATIQIKEMNNSIPIIAQTAYALESDKMKAYKIGCDGYLSKPINKEELLTLVKRLMRKDK